MSETKGYQGWKNYETWCVALWINNEEGSYDYWHNAAESEIREAPECGSVEQGIWSVEQASRYLLADRLKDEINAQAPGLDGMWSDLLSAALSEVDWDEIASSLLDDVRENAS